MTTAPIKIEVFRAADVTTTEGVMRGEPISFADELILDDVFQLRQDRTTIHLTLIAKADGLHRKDTGAPIHIDSCLTFMSPESETTEALLLVELAGDHVAAIYVLALGEMVPLADYRLVGVARHTATRRFADAASGSFGKGTQITMATGEMRPIETLSAGDLVLTRDAGRQPIARLGQATLRATGRFAPVVISQGALHNACDLVVRPDHRLFIYQREDHLGLGRAEVLVKARQLVDDKAIYRRRGGFIEYFQIVFAQQHIIYAEGIAAESHLVVRGDGDRHLDVSGQLHLNYEVADGLLPPAKAASLLRKASTA